MAHTVADLRAQSLKRIEERLQQAVRDGELGGDTNLLALARFIGAMIQGMSIQARDGASKVELAVEALPFRENKSRKARTVAVQRRVGASVQQPQVRSRSPGR